MSGFLARAWPSIVPIAAAIVLGAFGLYYFERATSSHSRDSVVPWTAAICGSACLLCGMVLLLFGILMVRRPAPPGDRTEGA